MNDKQVIADVQRLREELGELHEPVANPAFIVVSGLPGTGKSYFCRKLSERLTCVVLESDALRKVLFPSPNYNAEESYRLFQACHFLIEELLKEGFRVILDATNLAEIRRERLYHIVDRLQLKLIIVRVEAAPELVRQRLQNRLSRADPQDKSEADWMVYQKMKPRVQRIERHHFAVDTSRDITPVIDKIIREAKR